MLDDLFSANALILPVSLMVIGMAVRFYFWQSSMTASRLARSSRSNVDDFGLSFEERVAKKLAEANGQLPIDPAFDVLPVPRVPTEPPPQPRPPTPISTVSPAATLPVPSTVARPAPRPPRSFGTRGR